MGRSPEYYKTPVEGKTNRFVIKQSKEKLHRNFKKTTQAHIGHETDRNTGKFIDRL